MTVDKTEAMLGSYGPQQDEYTKIVSTSHAPLCERRARLDNPPHVGGHADSQFASEESPSGMLARSGSYAVKSRLIDDDKQVWLDFEWGELLTHPGYPTC
jgi:Rho GDP-dissociation inhibitor